MHFKYDLTCKTSHADTIYTHLQHRNPHHCTISSCNYTSLIFRVTARASSLRLYTDTAVVGGQILHTHHISPIPHPIPTPQLHLQFRSPSNTSTPPSIHPSVHAYQPTVPTHASFKVHRTHAPSTRPHPSFPHPLTQHTHNPTAPHAEHAYSTYTMDNSQLLATHTRPAQTKPAHSEAKHVATPQTAFCALYRAPTRDETRRRGPDGLREPGERARLHPVELRARLAGSKERCGRGRVERVAEMHWEDWVGAVWARMWVVNKQWKEFFQWSGAGMATGRGRVRGWGWR